MSEKKEKVLKQESIPPMGLKMIFREFLKDKMAIFSLVLLVAVLLFVFIGSAVIDQSRCTWRDFAKRRHLPFRGG